MIRSVKLTFSVFWIICFFSKPASAVTSDVRTFPPLVNLALNRPISGWPSSSTCGIPTRSSYCQSGVTIESLGCSRRLSCISDCPYRTTLPLEKRISLLVYSGQCFVEDHFNIAPNQGSGLNTTRLEQRSLKFQSERSSPDCDYLRPAQISKDIVWTTGFTLTSWIWLESSQSLGSLFKKETDSNRTILSVDISTNGLHISYQTTIGNLSIIVHSETLPIQKWFYIGIQIYNRTLSVFGNGLGVGFSPTAVYQLNSSMENNVFGTVSIGGPNFSGRLQDLFWFSDTLTNREMAAVMSGVLPSVHIQSECRCPASYPRVNPINTAHCIKNGQPDTTEDFVSRINDKSHPMGFSNDDNWSTYWVSSFLSNVSLTVDLGDRFQVFIILLTFYSPVPLTITLEREDQGVWGFWQKYALDCQQSFRMESNGQLTSPTGVNCLTLTDTQHSKDNVSFSLLSQPPLSRPGYNTFYTNPALFQFSGASRVRITLAGFRLAQQLDPGHRYFGLYNLDVRGRCNCHGHAALCDTTSMPYTCACLKESYTAGRLCNSCLPLYNDKPFRIGTPTLAHDCRPCQCNQHASACIYDAQLDPYPSDHTRGGGGRCLQCQHHTDGSQCEACLVGFFRVSDTPQSSPEACQACNCSVNGSVKALENGTQSVVGSTDTKLEVCKPVDGQCPCKQFTMGRMCDQCKPGYFNLTEGNPNGCQECLCDTKGTLGGVTTCHAITGQCPCKANVRDLKCNVCEFGYFELSSTNPNGCQPCNCDPIGSGSAFCNPDSGQCLCKENIEGRRCDSCTNNHYNFTNNCPLCMCNGQGTEVNKVCDKATGQCPCKLYVEGKRCDQCKDGFYKLGNSDLFGCNRCNCDLAGSQPGSICDKTTGVCQCKQNVIQDTCNRCYIYAWNLTESNPLGCQDCVCDPTGSSSLGDSKFSCDVDGKCICVQYRGGHKCDICNLGTYKNTDNKMGCLPCNCHPKGSVAGTFCDQSSGQCKCMADYGVAGRACDECRRGYFGFTDVNGRCQSCNCNPTGSVNNTCSSTGLCFCKQYVIGDHCDQCKPGSSVLDANNPYGCSKVPSQLGPPTAIPLNPTSLMINWKPPDHPNGNIIAYYLFRDGLLLFQSDKPGAGSYNDTNLSPYTAYTYLLSAANIAGNVTSRPVHIRTPSAPPAGNITLQVSRVLARSADLLWNIPGAENGPIVNYTVLASTRDKPESKNLWTGLAMSLPLTLTALVPFTNYTFTLRACTLGGCIDSNAVLAGTLEAPPGALSSPKIVALGATEFYVSWDHPGEANGVILSYEVWIHPLDYMEPIRRVFVTTGQYNPRSSQNTLEPPDTNTTIENLKPYTLYEVQITAQNAAGKSAGAWISARTGEAVPLGVGNRINVTGLNSSYLLVSWAEPSPGLARGQPVNWTLFQRMKRNPELNPFAPPTYFVFIVSGNSSLKQHELGEFGAYTWQEFMLEMCNSVGCVNSTIVGGRTDFQAPQDQPTPDVLGYNESVIAVSWLPPRLVNGPDPVYLVERSDVSLNYPPPHVTRGVRMTGSAHLLFPHDSVPENVAFTGIEMYFRTRVALSIMFFAASEGRQDEYIVIYMKEGKIYFAYATGSSNDGCSAHEVTPTDSSIPKLNDDNWHFLRVYRQGTLGTISVDDKWHGNVSAPADCNSGQIIGTNNGVFFGGIPLGYDIVRNELVAKLPRNRFLGCFRNVRILQEVSPDEQWSVLDFDKGIISDHTFSLWKGCPTNLEVGSHMLGNGFIRFPSALFHGGTEFRITMSLRTKKPYGLLLFIYGNENTYLIMQIRERFLEFYAKSPNFALNITLESPNICDDTWKKVEFRKVNAMLGISDGINVKSIGDETQAMPFALSSPIYMGGVPSSEKNTISFIEAHGLTDVLSPAFAGCLSNITSAYRGTTRFVPETAADTYANIYMDGCPIPLSEKSDGDSISSCERGNETFQHIYRGEERNTIDSNDVKPFTDYMYRVTAINPQGRARSPWFLGRSGDGIPFSMPAPNRLEPISGFILSVTWRRPIISTGYIDRYVIRAYPAEFEFETSDNATNGVDNTTNAINGISSAPENDILVQNYLPDVSGRALEFTFNISNLTPYTNYTVKVSACTSAGCTESNQGISGRTLTEAPNLVTGPRVLATGHNWLLIGWSIPGHPNGDLTGYMLWRRSELPKQVYAGGLYQFNDTGLQVYTDYSYSLEACTFKGCTSSNVVVLRTGQTPPSSMTPPKLTVLDSRRIQTEWSPPDIMNGKFARYLLFSSVNASSIGEVHYNSSDVYKEFILTDLTPGTQYYISIAACSGGGCTISLASTARTEEFAPEEVFPPNVTSPTPSTLVVVWSPPGKPNGVIVNYVIYQNDKLVANLSGQDPLYYHSSGLLPWSLHVIMLRVCTQRGCAVSPKVNIRTKEAAPSGAISLAGQVMTPRSVRLLWTNPVSPNGRLFFLVKFDGLFYRNASLWDYSTVRETRILTNMTKFGEWITVTESLLPFSQYVIQIEGRNSEGSLFSNYYSANMPPGGPDGVKPPTLEAISSTSIAASWGFIGRDNANERPSFQLQYRTRAGEDSWKNVFEVSTTATMSTIFNLKPYTEYEVRVLASNQFDSTTSKTSSVFTNTDVPADFAPPSAITIGKKSVILAWQPPGRPNGVLIHYNVYGNDKFLKMIEGNWTRYNITSLASYVVYTFRMEACTSAGCAASSNALPIRTLATAAENIPVPSLSSNSPTSVLISLSPPLAPNGILLAYELQRRLYTAPTLPTPRPIVTLRRFGPSDELHLVDQSSDIRPYTLYDYRVLVTNNAGVGKSDWSTVRTQETSPVGMVAPTLLPISSRVVRVSWAPPIEVNGRLDRYQILVSSLSPINIFNIDIISTNVSDLIPWTIYRIRVRACTQSGCTESPEVQVLTPFDTPEGLVPPSAVALATDYISVSWTYPQRPNGPSVNFELQRSKIRQPLEDNPQDINVWERIYTGLNTFYGDRNVMVLTTYLYKLTFNNPVSQLTSNQSEEVTSFGNQPTKAGQLSANVIDHISIRFNWSLADIRELQGYPVSFLILLTSHEAMSTSKHFAGSLREGIVDNLTPNTNYSCRFNVTVTGGKSVVSEVIFATTMEGAPSGLAAPNLTPVSENTLRVYFSAPSTSNGRIIGYFIHVDATRRIATGMTVDGSYLVNQLQPYTVYSIKVEVCTVFSCITSNATHGATKEATPNQQPKVGIASVSSSSLRLTWTPPVQSNGYITHYRLQRQSRVHCRNSSLGRGCLYVLCSKGQLSCGSSCYTPSTQICCQNHIFNKRASYACCGERYIPLPAGYGDTSHLVCCGPAGFMEARVNYECCGDYYLPRIPGKVCCPDQRALRLRGEQRVNIDSGDRCCAAAPFHSTGEKENQICCQDQLHDNEHRQCCGNQILSDKLICCGQSFAYTLDSKRTCCGGQYIPLSRDILCCQHSATDLYKVHYLTSLNNGPNTKCCGADIITQRGQSCCNSRGYDNNTHICSDRSLNGKFTGCGTGTVCPLDYAGRSFCDRCDYNPRVSECYLYQRTTPLSTSYSPEVRNQPLLTSSSSSQPEPVQGEGDCWSDPVTIHDALDFSFTDTKLTPYSEHQYIVTAFNTIGGASSPPNAGRTKQAAPAGVTPPRATPLRLDVILVSWSPATHPNGVIERYTLRRSEILDERVVQRQSGEEVYSGLELSFTDSRGIKVFTLYEYSLFVCNKGGCSTPVNVTVATRQGLPESMLPPTVTALSASSFLINWTAPTKPNGFIINYRVYEIQALLTNIMSTMALRTTLSNGLLPFTMYQFIVAGCTVEGCTNSSVVSARTLEAAPVDLSPPIIIVISASSVRIVWKAPDTPNGLITRYVIYKSLANDPSTNTLRRFSVNGSQYELVVNQLLRRESYSFFIEGFTSVGSVNSSTATVQMPHLTPEEILAPDEIAVTGPYSVFLKWKPPLNPQGLVDQYKITLINESGHVVQSGFGLKFKGNVIGLQPFNVYHVYVSACLAGLDNGCGTGPSNSFRTLEAAPEGQLPPTLTAVGRLSIKISWKPPAYSNGIVQTYRINRRLKSDTTFIRVAVLINSTEFVYIDEDPRINPFTDYEYNIEALNSVSIASSLWTGIKTLEDLSQLFRKPKISLIGPFSVHISWNSPEMPNGLITKYTVFYQELSTDPTITFSVSQIERGSSVYSIFISGLNPYTNYRIRVGCLNGAGFAFTDWETFLTLNSSPSKLNQMTAVANPSGTSISLTWLPPSQPNGVISEYRVYLLGEYSFTSLYRGLLRAFDYQSLAPYTNYQLVIEACINTLCSRAAPLTVQTAEILPTNQLPPQKLQTGARYIGIRWRLPLSPSGKIIRFDIYRLSKSLVTSTNNTRQKRSAPDAVIVYVLNITSENNNTMFEYIDTNLEPYTQYSYMVSSCNSIGCANSDWTNLTTKQAASELLNPPVINFIDDSFSSLNVIWKRPAKPNGIIMTYEIKRNETRVHIESMSSGFTYMFVDRGLLPYTVYAYTLTVCNQATSDNCATSAKQIVRTLEAAPKHLNPPNLNVINATTILANWSVPQLNTGVILSYKLVMNGEVYYNGLEFQIFVKGLIPYTDYVFHLIVCTRGGCSESIDVLAKTKESLPKGQNPPTVLSTSPTTTEVTWTKPQYPNGKLLEYQVLRNGVRVSTVSPDILFYRDSNLEPGRNYSYAISAFNSLGYTTSTLTLVRTLSSSPEGLTRPRVEALSSTSLQVDWDPPGKPRGTLKDYTIILNGSPYLPALNPSTTTTNVRNLKPYTAYGVRVKMCTDGGCSLTTEVSAMTLQAVPRNQQPPTLVPLGNAENSHSGVRIFWSPPEIPNGLITRYLLERTSVTLLTEGVEKNGAVLPVYEGPALEFVQNATMLLAHSTYRYRVTAYNQLPDGVTSAWATVTTKESLPFNVFAPLVVEVQARTARIKIQEPGASQINGFILAYHIYVNNSKVDTGRVFYYTLVNLIPFSTYSVSVSVCTGPGCTRGPQSLIHTLPDFPQYLNQPTVDSLSNTSVSLSWLPPNKINGILQKYILEMRDDATTRVAYEGVNRTTEIVDLKPYTVYFFRLKVDNQYGRSQNTDWMNITTDYSLPVYKTPPVFTLNGSQVVIDWSNTFILNSPVVNYSLSVDDRLLPMGTATHYQQPRETQNQKFIFEVFVNTQTGSISAPKVLFDINLPGYGGTFAVTSSPTTTTLKPVYQEAWFIIVMVLVGLLILLVVMVILLRHRQEDGCCGGSGRTPYVRERLPLHMPSVPLPPVPEMTERSTDPAPSRTVKGGTSRSSSKLPQPLSIITTEHGNSSLKPHSLRSLSKPATVTSRRTAPPSTSAAHTRDSNHHHLQHSQPDDEVNFSFTNPRFAGHPQRLFPGPGVSSSSNGLLPDNVVFGSSPGDFDSLKGDWNQGMLYDSAFNSSFYDDELIYDEESSGSMGSRSHILLTDTHI